MLILLLVALVILGPTPGGLTARAEAQTGTPASGVAAARDRLIAPNGTLLIALGSNVDLDAGTLTASEAPDLVALALACTALPARSQVTILGSLAGAPVKVKIERDKGGRLEVQLRGVPFADRARLFAVAETFLAKGAHDVRVEGPVAGRNIEARFRDRVPEPMAIPTVALPPPSPGPVAPGPPVELFGRWRSTTIPGATLILRPAANAIMWEYDAPTSGGLAFARGTVRAEGSGVANAEAVALSGRITIGDDAPGGRPGQGTLNLTLRREGTSLRGTAVGSQNRSLTVEFLKESTR